MNPTFTKKPIKRDKTLGRFTLIVHKDNPKNHLNVRLRHTFKNRAEYTKRDQEFAEIFHGCIVEAITKAQRLYKIGKSDDRELKIKREKFAVHSIHAGHTPDLGDFVTIYVPDELTAIRLSDALASRCKSKKGGAK